MKRLLIGAASAATIVLSGLAAAQAAEPKDFVDYRVESLKAVGGHMKAMSTWVKSGMDLPNPVAAHASAILAVLEGLPAAFPEGTHGVAKSEATSKVWSDPAAFKAANDKAIEAAKTLIAAADSNDRAAIGKALGGLGGACKGCHDDFRD
ncbi:c-type cytochrome [Pararhodospirillum oryzae]|uniref:Cytochrome c n=1 Tax=Pararhodospirillum oryzae TaxID=478448 RepID=A0A512HC58_9PROT|nr:cytochrome c [Pararhodospirillum oryzae]GEO83036.1 cytochrome c' [Pararhodospirillum oryzae]